ncbi:MAG: hemerythrin family protein [Gammaproteobacteria bacterium]|nr:hemerythrin family protein [Gammaproteobacteria bacterium]MCG3145166.1 Bacteriohemerythrin [Gammaproteobacteria bacterium]
MELMHWDEKYCVGLPEIDDEHRNLVMSVNELHAAIVARMDRGEIKGFFAKVNREVSAHFEHEERLMHEHQYQGYAEHRADHQRLLEDIGDIATDFADGVFDYDPDKVLGQRLTEWFVAHVRKYDAPMCEFLSRKTAA